MARLERGTWKGDVRKYRLSEPNKERELQVINQSVIDPQSGPRGWDHAVLSGVLVVAAKTEDMAAGDSNDGRAWVAGRRRGSSQRASVE